MVGGSRGWVKAALALALLSGCFWRSYGRLAATHADVLVGIARKGVDLVVAGKLTAESMPELTYPLERAEAFGRQAFRETKRPPPSLHAFMALVARYRDLVDAVDRVRREKKGWQAERALAAPLAAVKKAADLVRASLREEGRI